jgi:hypothetical protein
MGMHACRAHDDDVDLFAYIIDFVAHIPCLTFAFRELFVAAVGGVCPLGHCFFFMACT